MANGSSNVDSMEVLVSIVYFVCPVKRFHLCRVNKTMRKAVEASMFDIKKIAVSHTGGCSVMMTTVNPNNDSTSSYHCTIAPSSLSSLLHWAGFWIKSLSVTTLFCFASDGSRLETVRRVLEALNRDDACPNLTEFSVTSCRLVFDNAKVLGDVLAYVTKRQLEANSRANSGIDLADNPPAHRPLPFLNSLSLLAPSRCCNERILQMQKSRNQRSLAAETEQTRDLLQQVLDQCNGLTILNVDSLLMAKSLPIAALQYPTTLTQLKTARLGKTPGELSTVINNCSHLQIVEDLSGGFTRNENDIRALVSLADLRALSIVSATKCDKMVQLDKLIKEGFGDHPFGPRMVRPWPQITSITLNCVTSDFLYLLSRGCSTLQEVRIQVLVNTEAVTAEMIGYLSDLPALRVLIVEDKDDERSMMVGDSLLDAIASKCHRLKELFLFPCSVSLLSLQRLLRECRHLRSVTLPSLSIALETRDCFEMVCGLAEDLCDRKVTIIVQIREITGKYTSAAQIVDGQGTEPVMAISSAFDFCVHGREVCASCCFDAPVSRDIARRLELRGFDTSPRSFFLAQRCRPDAAIVFTELSSF